MKNNFVLHKAATRGHANHGWLDTWHTFSFADYYDPDRVQFGALRVLNDDTVAPGMGFGTHPHSDMEIISIPTFGDLEHRDNMGNISIIREGDIQVMSAGTGITHSEYNKNHDKEVKFFQIWIFPDTKNAEPRYDQITLNPDERKNKFQQVVSPSKDDNGLWIHQQAWFHLGRFDKDTEVPYKLKNTGNGVYVFVIEGDISVLGQDLNRRDGIGIMNGSEISVKATSPAEVLVMEVPLQAR